MKMITALLLMTTLSACQYDKEAQVGPISEPAMNKHRDSNNKSLNESQTFLSSERFTVKVQAMVTNYMATEVLEGIRILIVNKETGTKQTYTVSANQWSSTNNPDLFQIDATPPEDVDIQIRGSAQVTSDANTINSELSLYHADGTLTIYYKEKPKLKFPFHFHWRG